MRTIIRELINKKVSIEARAALVLTFSTFLCKGINFITTPVFTRVLTVAEMGTVTTYNSWYTLIYSIASLSLDSGSFNIAMMEYEKSRYEYMSNTVILTTISTALISLVYAAFRDFWLNLLGIDNTLMVLMLISFIFLPVTSFWMLHQRYSFKYKSIAAVTLLSTGLSTIVATFATVLAKHQTHIDLAHVRLISGNLILIFWGIIFYILIIHRGKLHISKKYIKFILVVNTPLLIHSMARHALDASDRLMISYLVGKREVAIYGVVFSISALAAIIWQSINASLIPYMFENIKEDKMDKVSAFLEKMLIVYSICCMCITLVAPEIMRILAPWEYYEGIYMIPPIAAGIYFTSLYNIFSNILLYYKKTTVIMISTVFTAGLNIALNYVCILLFGYEAAAYTTMISYIVLAIMQYIGLIKSIANTQEICSIKVWLISLVTVILCMIIAVLYRYLYIRYLLVCIGVLFVWINRKKFFTKT